MRYLVVIAAVAGAVLLFLLTTASANSALLARHYPLLLALNGAVVAVLLGAVAIQLRRLLREYRSRVFGSRLKYRLFVMFALMALLPGLLIYAVSVQFAVKSIESWFDVRVDAALEGGLNLGRSALDYLLGDLSAKARQYGAGTRASATAARSSCSSIGCASRRACDSATLLAGIGQILASSSAELGVLVPELPTSAQLRQVRQGRSSAVVEGDAASGLTLRVIVPVSTVSLTSEMRVLQLMRAVPRELASDAESVQAVYRDYQELSLARQGLRRIYTLTLTLALVLALLAAIAVALELSRRFSAPLLILAEGTQAVAQGDFSPRQALPARDELGVLTQSFNRMTRQLNEARAQAEHSRAEVEAARAYLESVLANLSAGVLAFDAQFNLRAVNRGACTVLHDSIDDLRDQPLAHWERFAELKQAIETGFEGAGDEWQQQLQMTGASALSQVLLVRGSRVPAASGGGYVVVFDDITNLLAAQRAMAWGEVARRLAHEIKNPLTPIQLSAERLQFKLSEKLPAPERDILLRATGTIVNQVEAMKSMVNEFRDYARLPQPTIAPLDLNALVGEVLALYETSRVKLDVRLEPHLPRVAADFAQMRQVIHNLLQNAEDALNEEGSPMIGISTRRCERGADLVVRDNGIGFAPHILARAFEPYVTTKSRGTGLGLAIVKKIVDEHHGEIHLDNVAPHGAEVRIRLPLAA